MYMSTITKKELEELLDSNISDICDQGFHNDRLNHCAHFVSHTLDYNYGYVCGNQAGKSGEGANIRVQEIFARCNKVGHWDDRPKALTQCLVFITKKGNVNVSKKIMSNVPRKHIGIFTDGFIYHYSNGRDKVVKQTPAQFSKHYTGTGYALFYGSL